MTGFDYTFKRGERIGIVGKNGVGKSTFLQIALQYMLPDSGKVNHGETVVFGHFSQDGLQYKEDKRVIEYVKDHAEFFPMADGTKIGASKFLERFAFTSEQQYTYLSKLSGGEKEDYNYSVYYSKIQTSWYWMNLPMILIYKPYKYWKSFF